MKTHSPTISVIDLFCGAGGLSYGLQTAGIVVTAGVDNDSACAYPFETNINASFIEKNITDVTGDQLRPLWLPKSIRLLAGCAPCTPFSTYRRGVDTSHEDKWPLLAEFGRLVRETRPELVTMENVPRIGSSTVFMEFVTGLTEAGYSVDFESCSGLDFGLAQTRRRLVLVASRLGAIAISREKSDRRQNRTVRDVIGKLPPLVAGCADPKDALHTARALSEINMKRIKASKPGGTWKDWPKHLRAPCHKKATGASFRNVYARMEWDKPSPTITTLSHNFGTGRFGHPEQDRAISLREAAMIQGFPRSYQFVRARKPVHYTTVGRLIGNAVPPPLGAAVGRILIDHVSTHSK